ncbi:hypothetical protein CTAYLR_004400 [Chrysophaeum taylorii]|uniref:Glycosyltransferase 61 catalytic domain-containing protein n=1 Tax=Chrysophaeum taylorii TaxID=2483200 RepID=A0AAD7XTI2_9STRA|nr:hypothetical protein CTAYLR_004400 [Chrysophaeum taylorii]
MRASRSRSPGRSKSPSRQKAQKGEKGGCAWVAVVLVLAFLWIATIEMRGFGPASQGQLEQEQRLRRRGDESGLRQTFVEGDDGVVEKPRDGLIAAGEIEERIGRPRDQPAPPLPCNEAGNAAWNKGVVSPPKKKRRVVPPVVDAFRKGFVDWHELIPTHSSLWERYGESGDGKFNFMKLVMKETMVTDFLTQYKESGLARIYGTDHGPLANYSSCNMLDDACAIHAKRTCDLDSLCFWDGSLCQSVEKHPHRSGPWLRCAEPQMINDRGSFRRVQNTSTCDRFVHEKALVVSVDGEASEMFYHWWRFFRGVFGYVKNKYEEKRIHFLIRSSTNTQFFHYFGLLSNSCWRRAKTQIPARTCFCDVDPEKTALKRGSEGSDAILIRYLVNQLGLTNQPEPTRIRVGLVSRRRKRFILNELELVDACLDLGLDVQVLPLEEMTLYEQLAALRAVTILVGIHGSGLNNAIFLRRGSVLVQLLPYKLNYKGAFQSNAMRAGVEYKEWALKDPKLSRFHWEFLGERELRNGRDAYLAKGSPNSGPEVYTFWINQDIIVPVDEFKNLIVDAIRSSPLNRNIANQMRWKAP